MLSDNNVDVVYVATPIGLHAEHGTRVLNARKHLWCEKPLTPRLQSTIDLLELARLRGLSVCEGLMYMYHPQFTYLREVLNSGRLGYIHAVSSRFGFPNLERPSFRTDAALGGGAFLDAACYPVSAMIGLFPDHDPGVLFAEIVRSGESAVDTSGLAVLGYPDGMSAVLEWGTGVAYRNEIDVWGAAGSIRSDRFFSKPADYVPRFSIRDIGGSETEEHGVAANHFTNMFAAFAELVRDESKAALERSMIMRRAAVMEKIRVAGSRQQG